MMKLYVVSPRPDRADALPDDWQGELGRIAGVEVQGSTPARLLVQASDAAMASAVERFGDDLRIEEASPRGLAP